MSTLEDKKIAMVNDILSKLQRFYEVKAVEGNDDWHYDVLVGDFHLHFRSRRAYSRDKSIRHWDIQYCDDRTTDDGYLAAFTGNQTHLASNIRAFVAWYLGGENHETV